MRTEGNSACATHSVLVNEPKPKVAETGDSTSAWSASGPDASDTPSFRGHISHCAFAIGACHPAYSDFASARLQSSHLPPASNHTMDASVPSATQIGLPEPRASLADARHAAPDLVLVSHALCPYVQRAAIVLAEKGVAFERRDINLADKPDWFRNISPLSKTPVLLVGDEAIFESAVICEYLDETALPRLHPTNALQRAQHRSWMEFGSALLYSIGAFYNATDEPVLIARAGEIQARFAQIEAAQRRAVLRRRALQHRRCGLRTCVPVFRRIRCDRRLRFPGGLAEGAELAPRLGDAAIGRRGGTRGLSDAAPRVSVGPPLSAVATHGAVAHSWPPGITSATHSHHVARAAVREGFLCVGIAGHGPQVRGPPPPLPWRVRSQPPASCRVPSRKRARNAHRNCCAFCAWTLGMIHQSESKDLSALIQMRRICIC